MVNCAVIGKCSARSRGRQVAQPFDTACSHATNDSCVLKVCDRHFLLCVRAQRAHHASLTQLARHMRAGHRGGERELGRLGRLRHGRARWHRANGAHRIRRSETRGRDGCPGRAAGRAAGRGDVSKPHCKCDSVGQVRQFCITV